MTRDPLLPDDRVRRALFAIAFVALVAGGFDAYQRVDRMAPDWTVYWTASRAVLSSSNPYAVVSPRGDRYIYPPFLAVALMPLAALPAAPALAIWYALNALAVAGIYCEWRRLLGFAGLRKPPPLWLTASVGAVVAMEVAATLQGGQTSVLILYCVLVAWRLVLVNGTRGASFVAGMLLALPVCIKLYPVLVAAGVVVLELLRRDRERTRARALLVMAGLFAGAGAGLLLLPALVVGWSRNLELLRVFYDQVVVRRADMHAEVEANLAFGASLASWARWIAAPAFVATLLTVIGGVAHALTTVVAFSRLARRARPIDLVAALSISAAAALFWSPVAWHHHFLLFFPFVAIVPLLLMMDGRERLAATSALLFVATAIIQQTLRELTGRTLPLLGIVAAGITIACSIAMARATTGDALDDGNAPLPVPSPGSGSVTT